MRKVLIALTYLTALSGTPLLAQSAAPTCDGDPAIVRVSQLKPTSNYQAFLKAQDAHLAWYRKNGFTDNLIYSSRVMVVDDKTKTMKYSDTDVVAFHVRPPAGGGSSAASKDQAGWDAYVKLYRDSSDLKAEYPVCLPKVR